MCKISDGGSSGFPVMESEAEECICHLNGLLQLSGGSA